MAHVPAFNQFGELGTSDASLLTTGEGQRVYVRLFSLYNKSGADVDATIKVNGRYLAKMTIPANGGSARVVEEDVLMIDESQSITGYASAANAVDYIISTVIRL